MFNEMTHIREARECLFHHNTVLLRFLMSIPACSHVFLLELQLIDGFCDDLLKDREKTCIQDNLRQVWSVD